MEEIRIADQLALIDPQATAAAYALLSSGGADTANRKPDCCEPGQQSETELAVTSEMHENKGNNMSVASAIFPATIFLTRSMA
jgi:hypothetical protein